MKRLFLILLVLGLVFTTSGCVKKYDMEDIDVITTIYPIEFVVDYLYGDNSNVYSIYPKGANINNYEFTNKQIKDFSEYDLFVYDGDSKERKYAISMLNNNHELMLINASHGVDVRYSKYDLWLNPSNILMIGQNVRNELETYISNPFLVEKINNQYQLLKLSISELETEFKKTADNSHDKRIISSDETLLFLNKYGFEVINLTENGERKENNISLAKSLLDNKNLSYVFIHEDDKNLEVVNSLIKDNSNILMFRVLEYINEEDMTNGDDYLSLMHDNIELIKTETYK